MSREKLRRRHEIRGLLMEHRKIGRIFYIELYLYQVLIPLVCVIEYSTTQHQCHSSTLIMPPTKGAGIVLRLFNPTHGAKVGPEIYVPGSDITHVTTIASTDDKVQTGAPSAGFAYHVKHISKFLIEGAYERDPGHAEAGLIQCFVYKRISQLSRDGHELSEGGVAPPGSVMVCVAITPGDTEDYSKWYDEEHQGMITKVPGWIKSERYELAKAYGSQVGAAPFLAVHFYDEKNGLGGPEWRASVETIWSKKIRENVVVPHYRRVWKVVEQKAV
jgi:hypothetical protein